jgi:hypothetical protein
MPPIEDLLRDELKRVADTVEPGQLRPLRVPVPRRRWHRRLLPVAAAAAVIAVAVAAVLVAGPKPGPASAPGPADIPRHYLTFTFVPDQQFHGLPVTEAVIRDSATGRITGTVKIVTNAFPAPVTVAAAPDDRSFIIATYGQDPEGIRGTSSREYRFFFFRLPISADGKPGHLTELSVHPVPMNAFLGGIALSPDGTLLAVSLSYGVGRQNGHAASVVAAVEVINLVTGKVRIWTAGPQHGHYYATGSPSWADGDRMIAFTWQHSQSLTNDNPTMEGVRLLDTDAPGDNLADSPMIVSRKAISGTIQSALITPDGRDVLLATYRNVPSGDNSGTVIAQIAEVSAAGSGPVSVLRTETARYTVNTKGYLDGASQVLSLDPTGRYALVQCLQFGWLDLDLGQFTPLPPYSSQAGVSGVW